MFLALLVAFSVIAFPGLSAPAVEEPLPDERPSIATRVKEKAVALIDRDAIRVPIILYHHVRPISNDMDQLGKDLSVTPERFSGHLAEFKKQGFHTIGLQDFADALEKKKPLPSKPVIFTFDDGYENAYTVALPILERHGMTGTVFVIGNAVGTPGYLSWGQLEDMVDSGVFEIQSHSLNHPDLASLSPELLRYELLGSKDLLESRLGLPMTFLCYPYGKYSAQVADAAKHAGYRGAVTTKYGTLHTKGALFETSRVRLTQHDTGARLEKKIRFLAH